MLFCFEQATGNREDLFAFSVHSVLSCSKFRSFSSASPGNSFGAVKRMSLLFFATHEMRLPRSNQSRPWHKYISAFPGLHFGAGAVESPACVKLF
jgi:hypothetical protein